jgi:hypothetical protein
LAFASTQRPVGQFTRTPDRSAPVGVAVGAALLFAAAGTLVLGIIPGEVLQAAHNGAHTLQAPPELPIAPSVTATERPTP